MSRVIITDPKKIPPPTKQAHLVPRFYLNHFADRRKFVWVYQRGNEARRASTKSLLTETDFFEYNVAGETTHNKYERWLAQIEDRAAKMYWKVLASSTLGQSEAEQWSIFVATLFLRTRKWRRQMVMRHLAQDSETSYVADMQNELFKIGHLVSRPEIATKLEAVRSEMSKQPAFLHVRYMSESVRKIASVLLEKSWHTISSPANGQFVTSDAPVTTIRLDDSGKLFDGFGFSVPDVAVCLPIAPNKLFVASPRRFKWRTELSLEDQHLFNRVTTRFAEEHVIARSPDPELWARLEPELNGAVFGETAFRERT